MNAQQQHLVQQIRIDGIEFCARSWIETSVDYPARNLVITVHDRRTALQVSATPHELRALAIMLSGMADDHERALREQIAAAGVAA